MKITRLLSLILVLISQVVLAQELSTFWYEYIVKQGVGPYNPQGSAYQVYRNVKSFGAKGISFLLRHGGKVLIPYR
jgi:glucan 1,3-beta-glucosidase